ncbi:MAG: GNAT family N-acetyltransferase [Chitinophagales bacterium]|nr:GNAT family N-acetyltransferase [Chitinophagales bacterium]
MKLNFEPFPVITSERLLLRKLKGSDQHAILVLRSDERILKYLDIAKANNLEDAIRFIVKINNGIANNECIYWGITLKNNGRLIGTICLWNLSLEDSKAEIGYVLHPEFQGKGLMQESMGSVIAYGFKEMQLEMIDAVLHPDNVKSIQVLERKKFTRVLKGEDGSEMHQETIYYSLRSSDH